MSTFTPSVTINETDTIAQTDDKLRTIINELTEYVNTNIKDGDTITNISSSKIGNTTTVAIEGTFDNSPFTFDLTDGVDGTNGLSAYGIALNEGFEGSVSAWLASLKGTDGTVSFDSLTPEQIESLKGENGIGIDGNDGLSAYQVAVENGYIGTEIEWLTSLNGTDGIDGNDGLSAYQVAVENGYTGTEEEWLVSLKGTDGSDGNDGNSTFSTTSELTQTTASILLTNIISGTRDVKLNDLIISSNSNSNGYYGLVSSLNETNATITYLGAISGSGGNSIILTQPVISSPISGTVDFIGEVTSNSYATSNTYKGTLDYVEWQLATDNLFENIIDTKNNTLALSYTPINTTPSTEYYVRVRYGSDNHLSNWSNAVNFTTPAAVIYTPTISSPSTGATDLGKNIAITSSNYSIFGHSETHLNSDWQIASDVNFTNILFESLNDTSNLLSWTTPNLTVSTTYYVRVKYKSTTYESAYSNAISFTTKAQFTPTIGTQGLWGFGTAPTDQPFALLGLAEMTGTNEYGHDNYGNYIHTNGSIVCWRPKGFYRTGHTESPLYSIYGENSIDIVGTDIFETELEANAAGYILPRCFINNGIEQPGFFQDKYMNSKDGTTSSKSIFGGVPISLTTTATYTNSNGMAGCTGILADAVVLSKSRGSRWNCSTAFMYAWAFMISVAHGQAATSTTDCSWYDPTLTTNFPKGCNNNALSDTNDTSVVYATAGDSGSASKPKTGATSNFNKTTDNGCANGIADLNGCMWEVSIGITNLGASATSTTSITNNTIYVLKESIDHADLTGGWNGANDAWGDATNLATKYDIITASHALGSTTGWIYLGNSSNDIWSDDINICGFVPKDNNATSETGINLFGNDGFYRSNVHNLTPLSCGRWLNADDAGLGCRSFNHSRSSSGDYASFRASAYFG